MRKPKNVPESPLVKVRPITGREIREFREHYGMTQDDLGLIIGFHQPAVSRIEVEGPSNPTIWRLMLLGLQVVLEKREARKPSRAITASSAAATSAP